MQILNEDYDSQISSWNNNNEACVYQTASHSIHHHHHLSLIKQIDKMQPYIAYKMT